MATRNIVPRADLEGSIGTASKRWLEGYIKTLYADDFEFGSSITIEGSIPAVHLHGTEGSALDMTIRENAGNIELYAETAAQVRTQWSGTDGRRQIPLIDSSELDSNAVITAKITDKHVTYAKIADATGLSVLGRASNSSGVMADITAGSDGQVLRRSGTAVGFGTVVAAGIASDAVETAKILNLNVTKAKINNGDVSPIKIYYKTLTALSDADANPTAAQLLGGLFTMTPGAARNFNLPTAASLCTELGTGYTAGVWFDLVIANRAAATYAITIVTATGWTFSPSSMPTITFGTTGLYTVLITGTDTATLFRVSGT